MGEVLLRIEIDRAGEGGLVINHADTVALEFFEGDISTATEQSYDECARRTDPNAPFLQEDVAPIRTGMRLGRLRQPTWEWLVDESPRAFLTELGPQWDLVAMSDEDWPAVQRAIASSLYDFMGAGRGAPVATKFLHYKRRRLFPILDSAVMAMLGLRIPDPTTSKTPAAVEQSRKRRAETTARACGYVRAVARENMESLQAIQEMLLEQGKDRSTVRILDALVWSVHPASRPSHAGTISWTPG